MPPFSNIVPQILAHQLYNYAHARKLLLQARHSHLTAKSGYFCVILQYHANLLQYYLITRINIYFL